MAREKPGMTEARRKNKFPSTGCLERQSQPSNKSVIEAADGEASEAAPEQEDREAGGEAEQAAGEVSEAAAKAAEGGSNGLKIQEPSKTMPFDKWRS